MPMWRTTNQMRPWKSGTRELMASPSGTTAERSNWSSWIKREGGVITASRQRHPDDLSPMAVHMRSRLSRMV